MKSLTNYSKDKIKGFVAFNPKREDGLNIVKDGIENNGFIGIKFYPPMGYKPIGNTNSDIEENIQRMFEWSIEKDIPVFTHCTPVGFEAIPGITGKNSDPQFWEELLKQPGFENLRLCLGHAGGEDGWKSKPTEEEIFPLNGNTNYPYARLVHKLCVNYPNVYCEMGFLAHIYNENELNNFTEKLLVLLSDKSTKYPFSEKFCYGSDYHILFNEGLEKSYLNKFIEIFSDEELNVYREDFFHANASKFLKLNQNV